MHYQGICAILFLIFCISGSLASINSVAALPNPLSESAQIATMPMTSNMADEINNIDSINTTPYSNNAISPGGDSNVPVTSGGADSNNQFLNPNNISTVGTASTVNNHPLGETTLLNSGIAPNTLSHINGTNNISAYGDTSTNNNQPLEDSKSLNSITPSTPGDANINQVLDKESILRSELQEIIQGDQECNDLYDDTIITWKNIVDRTKNIQKQFGLADTDTTTTTTTFEICGNNQDDDGDGRIDETCPDIDDPDSPEICRDGIDNDNDGLIDENCPETIPDEVIPGKPEIPDNDRDDDGDYLIDETCSGFPVDLPVGEVNVADGVDNDNDRLIDETGPDHPFINTRDLNNPEIPGNEIDDDGDRLIDETCCKIKFKS